MKPNLSEQPSPGICWLPYLRQTPTLVVLVRIMILPDVTNCYILLVTIGRRNVRLGRPECRVHQLGRRLELFRDNLCLWFSILVYCLLLHGHSNTRDYEMLAIGVN